MSGTGTCQPHHEIRRNTNKGGLGAHCVFRKIAGFVLGQSDRVCVLSTFGRLTGNGDDCAGLRECLEISILWSIFSHVLQRPSPYHSLLYRPTGSSISTPDLSSATEGAKDAADSAKGAASDLKSKAQSALSGLSAVPNSTATLADQNADVRGLSANYRDPAGAIQQDKAKGELACCFIEVWFALTCVSSN